MMIAIPSLACRSFISSRICAWIVTSSAVVGSSAIRMSGSQASAIAIMTLCLIPPENSKGYCLIRFWGSFTPTSSSISIARSRASLPRLSVCSLMASSSWYPIVKTGFRLVMGSWNMMEHRLPRKSRILLSGHFVMSSPLYRIWPDLMDPFFSRICMMEYAETDLPDPDSPTMPRILPAVRLKETPLTALTSPLSVVNDVWRSTTDRIVSSAILITSLVSDQMRPSGRRRAG